MGNSLGISKAGAPWVFCENRIFKRSWVWKFMFVWVDLSIGSVLERLVLKNAAECTIQRLKWTSGARVMIFWNKLIVVLSPTPCGRLRSWKIVIFWNQTICRFVSVALRAASTLKNLDFSELNYLPFCLRRPVGGLDLEKSWFFVFTWISSHCKTA